MDGHSTPSLFAATSSTTSLHGNVGEYIPPLQSEPMQDPEVAFTPADIRRLNGDIDSLEQYFVNVESNLKTVRRKVKLPLLKLTLSRGRTPLENAYSRWQKLHKEFKGLIEESRLQAMVAWASLQGFDHVVASQVIRDSDGRSKLKREIDMLIDAMAAQMGQASTLRERMRILIQEVHSIYVDVCDASGAARLQEAGLFEELAQALRTLGQLKSSFSSISKEFSALRRACITCFSVVVPTTPSGTAHDTSSQYQKATDSAINLSAEIRRKEEEAADLERNRNAVRDRLSLLVSAEQDIKHIAESIDFLPEIWNSIKVNMMEVNAQLTTVIAGDQPTSFFDIKLELARRLYKKLSAILHAYAAGSER
ncbi:hypothetical protein GY45DRAFT_1361274 [Cubamyces sp. BRFM 1775]|nr:hypothetical protein GY45DRAFT_1361274 [Cubamyces sp. BRFM 1775]